MTRPMKRYTDRLLISMSGGETSAYMCWWLLRNYKELGYQEALTVFANTGEEAEETLQFIHRCDQEFGFNTHWIESYANPQLRASAEVRRVDFASAARKGEPFEAVIQKHGLPGPVSRRCSSYLKRDAIYQYLRERVGWKQGTFDLAIGIRVDEMDRISLSKDKRQLVYPLIHPHAMTKPQINTWWRAQPFRLELKGYQGNCKWCWAKPLRKLMTIMDENPEWFEFPERMERLYPTRGPEFRRWEEAGKAGDPPPTRRIFQNNRTVAIIREELAKRKRAGVFVPSGDSHQVFDPDLDVGGMCEETCEVFSSEDQGEDEELEV